MLTSNNFMKRVVLYLLFIKRRPLRRMRLEDNSGLQLLEEKLVHVAPAPLFPVL